MPIAAFIDDGHLPALGLTNAWGYNPVTYFAVDPRLAPRGPHELRHMTDLYRKNGISVILDVVYNHTGEGDALGPMLSMKGLDARTYYRHVEVDGKQHLVNDTGTGNTLRCDHPAMQRLVIESLRYWVEELGVSGFRFDLAPMLGREPGFNPNAKMLQMIKTDPVLSKCLLVAEPWDPGPGGYQLGQFGKEFREHNDTYRDEVRSVLARRRRQDRRAGGQGRRLGGDLQLRRPQADARRQHARGARRFHARRSRQLWRQAQRGQRRGQPRRAQQQLVVELRRRGADRRRDDPQRARKRDVRALLATLFFSRGVPLLQQGDEMGRTQRGNNNAYAQDNEITWVDWEGADGALVDYVAARPRLPQGASGADADKFFSGPGQGRGTRCRLAASRRSRDERRRLAGSRAPRCSGMDLRTGRRSRAGLVQPPCRAGRPRGCPKAGGRVGLVSDDQAEVAFAERHR